MQIEIDFQKIEDWESFHTIFKEMMGFPDFYGRNMDAWIDCMSYIDEPESGMSSVTVNEGECLEIKIKGTESAFKDSQEIFQAFIECSAFVNQRFIESGSNTRIKLIAT